MFFFLAPFHNAYQAHKRKPRKGGIHSRKELEHLMATQKRDARSGRIDLKEKQY